VEMLVKQFNDLIIIKTHPPLSGGFSFYTDFLKIIKGSKT
jgi:hypothetical protein